MYVVELHEEIAPAAARLIERSLAAAQAKNATHFIIDLDTYGGLVDAADDIRSALLDAPFPTAVLVRNNAASAGALISISCDSIYMRSGSTIGAATVVNQEGEVAPDKYQSYMRQKMRATAEAKGRNADIAEAMVDPDKSIEGISKVGKVLTFTVDEAIAHGYCEAKLSSIELAAQRFAQKESVRIEQHQLSLVDKMLSKLMSPYLTGILLMIIIGGIYFELQTPGIGFPIVASLLAAVLYFAPNYLEGLAANWEIALFVLGVILIGVELFVLPGFGIAGVLGISAVVAGLALSLVNNIDFDFTFVPQTELIKAFGIVIGASLGSVILMLVFGYNILESPAFNKLALTTTQQASEGFVSGSLVGDSLVGYQGVAETALKPSGKVRVEGKRYDAISDGRFIAEGSTIVVRAMRGSHLKVEAQS